MRKVISLVLAIVMVISVFAVLPTASAAETVYKAGTEIQMLWKLPTTDYFTGIQFMINYDENLEYVKKSANCPNVPDAYINDKIANEFNINASDISEYYDLSADHIMCQANFIVKEDTTDLAFSATIEELYILVDYEDIDIDRTNEFEINVISVPTEPEPKTVYFVNTADWSNVNAYAWVNGVENSGNSTWPGLQATKTELVDPNGKEVYSYTFTEDYDTIIFNNASDQTSDLEMNEGKYYHYTDKIWYDSLEAIPVITEGTTAPPVVSLMGEATNWETGTEMSAADGGVYTTVLELAAGTYKFKVKVNDDIWYGNDGTIVDTTGEGGWDMYNDAGDCKLQATGGTYTFMFDVATNKLVVLADIIETEPEEPSSDPEPVETVVSLMGITDWETGTEMIPAGDGIYTAVLELANGTYEFKVKVNGDWYGNNGTIVDTTEEAIDGWDMYTADGNCKLQATGGIYTFSFDTTTNKLIVLAEIEDEPSEVPGESEPAESDPSESEPAESRTVYFVPNDNWKSNDARFAAYVFTYASLPDIWVEVADEDGDGIYQCEVPGGYNQVIFTRMNPSTTNNNWYDSTVWNKTVDLTIPDDGRNLFTMNSNDWSDANGTWSVYVPEEPSEESTPSEEESSSSEEESSSSEETKNGIYEEDGKLYYYKDGAKYYAGLIMIDGDYYYVNSSCIVITGKKYTVSKTNYLLPRGVYEFDEDGKMLNPPEKEVPETTEAPAVKNGIFEEDGVKYYYKDNAKYYAGLIMIGDYYYYVNSSCKVITGKSYYVSKTNNLLPSASYTFDLDGKMLNAPVEESTEASEDTGAKNGFVVENGVTYYYVDGVKTYAGVIEIDGYYYYVNSSCIVLMGKKYYVSKTNNLVERGSYTFDAEGKMVEFNALDKAPLKLEAP